MGPKCSHTDALLSAGSFDDDVDEISRLRELIKCKSDEL